MRTSVKYLLFFISLMAVSCSKQADIIDNQEIVFSATNLTISVADLKNTQNSQGLNGAYLFEDQTSFQDKEGNGGFFNINAYKSGESTEYFTQPTTVFYHTDTQNPAWYIYNPDTKEIEKRYWPVSYSLDFFAYMPLQRPTSGQNLITQVVDPKTYISDFSYDETTKSPTFKCKNLPLDKDGQDTAKEFIYAWTPDQSVETVDETDGKVPLCFRHAMAAVSVQIAGAHAGTQINSLGFNNIYNNGTFNVANNEWTLWKPEGVTELNNLSIVPTNHIIPDTIQIGYTYGPYLVLPQDFGNNVEIAINFTWRDTPNPIAKKLKDVLPTHPQKWESGKKYIYSLVLGDSSEDIMVNVKIEPWGVGGSQEIEIK